MRRFTKEELDKLNELCGENLYHAVHSNFYRNTPRTRLMNIKAIYDDATGGHYTANWSCSHCILKFLKEVGKKYYADLEEYNNKAEEFVEVLDEVMADVPDEKPVEEPKPVKKTTTKKKSTKKTTKK